MTTLFDIKGLRKYFGISAENAKVSKRELLSGTEALKAFGLLWGDHKKDAMTMLTVIEYEYITNNSFSEKELNAVKQVLGEVALFLKGCEKEYAEFREEQAKRVIEN